MADDDDLRSEEANLNPKGFEEVLDEQNQGRVIRKRLLKDELPSITPKTSDAERTAALKKVLFLLAKGEPRDALSEDDLEALWSFFQDLYAPTNNSAYRHEYAVISSLMYEMLEEGEKEPLLLIESLPPQLIVMASNMTLVFQHAAGACGNANASKASVRALSSLRKLNDHIQLEFRRMRYQVHQNEILHKNINKVTDQYTEKVSQASKGLEDDFKDSINEAAAKSQRSYVSVLGIFISLVIAFSAGIRLSTEIIDTIVKMGPYRMAAILVALGAGLGDLVLVLLYFVLVVSEIEGSSRKTLKQISRAFNIVMGLLMLLILWARMNKFLG